MTPVINDLLATTRKSWNLPAVVHKPPAALLLRHSKEWAISTASPRDKASQGFARNGDVSPQRMRLCMQTTAECVSRSD